MTYVPSGILNRNVRTIAGSSLTTSYQNVGAVLTIAGMKIAIVNATTTDVLVTDGTTADAWYVPAGSTICVGEGFKPFSVKDQILYSVEDQTQLQAKLASGSAGTGTLVITVIGY
jgi:hypothetical protein